MSDTIWFEQVDSALIDFIRNGVHIGDIPVKCKMRKPDEDFKREEYPLISISNIFYTRDDFRRHYNGFIPVKKDAVNKVLTVEEAGIPYNLFYQIDFWALQFTQMNSMTHQWIAYTNGGRDFNLPVETVDGVCTTRYAMCTDSLRRVDFLNGTDRALHTTTTYRIYVEIDENVPIEQPLVTDVRFNTKKEF